MTLTAEQTARLQEISTATLTTVLLKKGLRNIWLRGTKPLRPDQKLSLIPSWMGRSDRRRASAHRGARQNVLRTGALCVCPER